MTNGPTRAAFWMRFIGERCGYPAPTLLRDQLQHAEASEFCDCGCNSFRLRVDPARARPLLTPPVLARSKGSCAVFEANFRLPDEKTLEIILFADQDGRLDYLEVDCCANSYPIPDDLLIEEPPFYIRVAENLMRE